jgi:hypothetical protein
MNATTRKRKKLPDTPILLEIKVTGNNSVRTIEIYESLTCNVPPFLMINKYNTVKGHL